MIAFYLCLGWEIRILGLDWLASSLWESTFLWSPLLDFSCDHCPWFLLLLFCFVFNMGLGDWYSIFMFLYLLRMCHCYPVSRLSPYPRNAGNLMFWLRICTFTFFYSKQNTLFWQPPKGNLCTFQYFWVKFSKLIIIQSSRNKRE